jgi:hypothetical protein
MRPAADLIQLRHRPVEPLFVVVDRDDDAASCAMISAVARPMPLAAAVISATLS